MVTAPPIVHVRWWDTFGIDDGWYDLNEPHHNRILETCGYLVGETENYLHIASTFDLYSGQYTTAIAIYKPCIKSRTVIDLK